MKPALVWLKENPLVILLALALTVRLYNVEAPLIGAHSWRQTQTAMIARNFYENGHNFFYPQVDWGGSTPGYFESEFPIYAYVVSLVYQIAGFSEVWA
ncbi:MAG TPA: hypothetical protein VGA55_01830, partial [Bacteroidota bacterium]